MLYLVVGIGLLTVTITAVDVVVPIPLVAVAVNVWGPLVASIVFHLMEKGALISWAPSADPSSRSWTAVTAGVPDAKAVTVMLPETVAPFTGDVMATAGGVLITVTIVKFPDKAASPPATALIVAVPTA
jgi:hypothetical protein